MLDNYKARKEVKLLKAMNDVTYKEFAEMANIKSSTLYNWLAGSFSFGEETLANVSELIADLKGE